MAEARAETPSQNAVPLFEFMAGLSTENRSHIETQLSSLFLGKIAEQAGSPDMKSALETRAPSATAASITSSSAPAETGPEPAILKYGYGRHLEPVVKPIERRARPTPTPTTQNETAEEAEAGATLPPPKIGDTRIGPNGSQWVYTQFGGWVDTGLSAQIAGQNQPGRGEEPEPGELTPPPGWEEELPPPTPPPDWDWPPLPPPPAAPSVKEKLKALIRGHAPTVPAPDEQAWPPPPVPAPSVAEPPATLLVQPKTAWEATLKLARDELQAGKSRTDIIDWLTSIKPDSLSSLSREDIGALLPSLPPPPLIPSDTRPAVKLPATPTPAPEPTIPAAAAAAATPLPPPSPQASIEAVRKATATVEPKPPPASPFAAPEPPPRPPEVARTVRAEAVPVTRTLEQIKAEALKDLNNPDLRAWYTNLNPAESRLLMNELVHLLGFGARDIDIRFGVRDNFFYTATINAEDVIGKVKWHIFNINIDLKSLIIQLETPVDGLGIRVNEYATESNPPKIKGNSVKDKINDKIGGDKINDQLAAATAGLLEINPEDFDFEFSLKSNSRFSVAVGKKNWQPPVPVPKPPQEKPAQPALPETPAATSPAEVAATAVTEAVKTEKPEIPTATTAVEALTAGQKTITMADLNATLIKLFPQSTHESNENARLTRREKYRTEVVVLNGPDGKRYYVLLPKNPGDKLEFIKERGEYQRLERFDATSWQEIFYAMKIAYPETAEAVQQDIVNFLDKLEDQQRLDFFHDFEVNANLGGLKYRISVDAEGKLKVTKQEPAA